MAQEVIKEWKPAIYARLSDEDGRAGVSLSIEHQIGILRDFVSDHGWSEPKVFYDDDKTGTDFNHKGFQDMYAEAQKGSINLIAIKDTSRFGRNWVQSGVYFEAIESMGVRFISIQEGIDTIDPKCPALKMLPFYFIFAEWHSQTTSEKIRTVFEHNAKQGKFRGTFAPYGYVKSVEDTHKLVVDPVAAVVVKKIYELRLQKWSYKAIADNLNKSGIVSSSAYLAEKNGVMNKWTCDAVSRILLNPAYCGDIANGKSRTVSYKNHTVLKQPFEDWIIVQDTHEAIVSREDSQKCRDMVQIPNGRVRSAKNGVVPFSGMVRCADCDYVMTRCVTSSLLASGDRKKYYGYNCGTYIRSGSSACTSRYISEYDLNAIVSADIREKAANVLQDEQAARERFFAIKATFDGKQLNSDRNALKRVTKRISELDKLLKGAFEKSILGGFTSEMLKDLAREYEAEKRTLTEQAERLTLAISKQSRTESDVDTFIALIKKHVNITELDRATTVELIDHIAVSSGCKTPREVTIFYNFVGNVKQG